MTKQISVWFDEKDRQKITKMADTSGLSEAAVVRQAFRIAIINGWVPDPDGAPVPAQQAQRDGQKAS